MDSNQLDIGFEPTADRRGTFVQIGLHARAACFTVIRAMISMAYTTHMLFHGTPGAGGASCWPKVELAQRTNDAASGV